MSIALNGCLEKVKFELLIDDFDILEMLVNGLRIFPKEYRLLGNLLLAIRSYIQIQDDNPMLDFSILGRLKGYGLMEEITLLLECPYENTRLLAENILDEYDEELKDNNFS